MNNTKGATGKLERFCVVGLGNHARTKLIPALVANNKQIVGLVTRQQEHAALPDTQVFRHIEDALSELPSDTAFVLATPPAVHFAQAAPVITSGRDLFVEKPAFVAVAETELAVAEAQQQGTVLAETFMHRHTALYRRLMAMWRNERPSITDLDIRFFLLPEMPLGTFRQSSDIAASSLYDVGCYTLSLLADLGLLAQSLELKHVNFPGACNREAVQLAGAVDGISINIRVGIGTSYINAVSYRAADGSTTSFAPFFYGRPGARTILHGTTPTIASEVFDDGNAFEAMFAVPRAMWLESQVERAEKMILTTAALERLGGTLAAFRRSAKL